jgi:geranylgeranyl pyrophosphate synthase
MVPIAVQQALRGVRRLALTPDAGRAIVAALMRASGATGMVGGQLMDLEGEGRALDVPDLEAVHGAKTGALIAASMRIGAMAGRASPAQLDAIDTAGQNLGLAFQIADDVLDATASSEVLGKTAGHDAALAKSTYASTLGVATAGRRRDELIEGAMRHLDHGGMRTPALEHLANFVAARRS